MTHEKRLQECESNCQEKSGSSENVKMKIRKEKPFQTKVVIRRLPPTMTEEQFMDQISPVPENDYFYFVKGDLSMGLHSFSRAYINFLNQEEIFIFKDKFDNYVFLDNKGAEYAAIVEFAPFQKIPKKKSKKRDIKCGTIDQDPEYIKFLESLNQEETAQLESGAEPADARDKDLKSTNGTPKASTPLLEYLKQKKQEQQKIREEKREERKRREIERRRVRDEMKKKKRAEKEKAKEKKDLEKEEEAQSQEDTPTTQMENITVLKNPDRDRGQEKESLPASQAVKPSSSNGSVFKAKPRPKKDTSKDIKERRINSKKRIESSKPSSSNFEEKKVSLPTPAPMVSSEEKCKVEEEDEDDDSKGSTESSCKPEETKDPRADRKIRNKYRPSLEIYRPGMRRLARNSPQKEVSTSTSNSSTPSPTPQGSATSVTSSSAPQQSSSRIASPE